MSFLLHLRNAGLDLAFPPRCPGCGLLKTHDANEGPHRLCLGCEDRLWPCETPCCDRCGEPFALTSNETFTCFTCAGRRFFFDYAIAAYQSRDGLREMIHRFKYQRELALRQPLGDLLSHTFRDPRLGTPDQWLAVPVPLHHRRYREREFNQALELCRILKNRLGVPYLDALERVRYTTSQTTYQRDERIANLKGAFTIRRRSIPRLKNRRLLLVDDVFTTGSTANECARTLRQEGGAIQIVVITVARG